MTSTANTRLIRQAHGCQDSGLLVSSSRPSAASTSGSSRGPPRSLESNDQSATIGRELEAYLTRTCYPCGPQAALWIPHPVMSE